jgi:hypothetical protein
MVEGPQGLEKEYYGGRRKLVHSQVQRNLGNLRTKFSRSMKQAPNLKVDYLIYCPDHRVIDLNAAGIDRQRTVDASTSDLLAKRVQKILGNGKNTDKLLRRKLHDFLLSGFYIAPDLNAFKTKQKKVYTQLLEGLSEVIDNLEFSPFRLRVVGTAGSGKTQVTMRFCQQALEQGEKPLLLCFNRPLADKLVALAPEGVTVNTYHGFCKEMAEQLGVEVDFDRAEEPDFWRNIQEQLLAATLAGAPKWDCLVVDEGQDFKRDWYDILQMFVTEHSTQLWLAHWSPSSSSATCCRGLASVCMTMSRPRSCLRSSSTASRNSRRWASGPRTSPLSRAAVQSRRRSKTLIRLANTS